MDQQTREFVASMKKRLQEVQTERERLDKEFNSIQQVLLLYPDGNAPAKPVVKSTAKPSVKQAAAKSDIGSVDWAVTALGKIGHEAAMGEIRTEVQKQGANPSAYFAQMLSRDTKHPKGRIYRAKDGKLGLRTWKTAAAKKLKKTA